MPNWQPNRQDVRWNYDAAHQAVGALRRAADELESSVNARLRAAEQAQEQWRGVHRLTFDAHLDQSVQRARALAREYRELAERIVSMNYQVEQEQARRVQERRRWEYEKAEEERRARQRQV